LSFGQYRLSVFDQLMSAIGERQAAGCAVEQRRANLPLSGLPTVVLSRDSFQQRPS